jgi:pyruvate/2-oxoglutarate dehydrogenase complex dihydrolipoamide dehydrogenase (E3) component
MSEKYDVAVIGSGSGGSEAALLAAKKGFRASDVNGLNSLIHR